MTSRADPAEFLRALSEAKHLHDLDPIFDIVESGYRLSAEERAIVKREFPINRGNALSAEESARRQRAIDMYRRLMADNRRAPERRRADDVKEEVARALGMYEEPDDFERVCSWIKHATAKAGRVK